MPLNDSATSKCVSVTARSQNWCCSTTVISSGYCSRSRARELHARRARVERDVEMVLARQAAGLGHIGRARGAPRRAAPAGSTDRSGCGRRAWLTGIGLSRARHSTGAKLVAQRLFARKMKVEASVARCLRTPPAGAYPVRTLSIGITNRLRGLRNRSIVVVGNYGLARYVGAISGKSTSFTPSSILFRPRRNSRFVMSLGGAAGYCPRVR